MRIFFQLCTALLLAGALPLLPAQERQVPEIVQSATASPLAQELQAFPDTDAEGLRRRIDCIVSHLEKNRERYPLAKLAAPDTASMDIRTAILGNKNYLGLTSWFTNATVFGANIEFYLDNMPPATPERPETAMNRELIVNDTLVHELMHVYFCSRYPKISSGTEDARRMVYEGHAMHAAYLFVNEVYFQGKLTTEQYATLMLSPRYTRYYQWYRENILTPDGQVRWDVLDSLELRNAPRNYYVRTRKPYVKRASQGGITFFSVNFERITGMRCLTSNMPHTAHPQIIHTATRI